MTKETGWVVEHRSSPVSQPMYWTGFGNGQGIWCDDHLQAIRFAREEDARKIADNFDTAHRVCEHIWL